MDKTQVIEMARSAGVYSGASEFVFAASLERFAALVAAHEREQCALECIAIADGGKMAYDGLTAEFCARSIRANRDISNKLMPDAYLPNGDLNPKYLKPDPQ